MPLRSIAVATSYSEVWESACATTRITWTCVHDNDVGQNAQNDTDISVILRPYAATCRFRRGIDLPLVFPTVLQAPCVVCGAVRTSRMLDVPSVHTELALTCAHGARARARFCSSWKVMRVRCESSLGTEPELTPPRGEAGGGSGAGAVSRKKIRSGAPSSVRS